MYDQLKIYCIEKSQLLHLLLYYYLLFKIKKSVRINLLLQGFFDFLTTLFTQPIKFVFNCFHLNNALFYLVYNELF